MDAVQNLLGGFASAFTPMNLFWVAVGVVIGTLVGILPGLGPPATLAILLPVTISLPPTTGLIMMAGIYHGAKFAGATTSILLNIPGETSSVVLCLDGHPLALKGRAGPAMGMSAIAGFIASTVRCHRPDLRRAVRRGPCAGLRPAGVRRADGLRSAAGDPAGQ